MTDLRCAGQYTRHRFLTYGKPRRKTRRCVRCGARSAKAQRDHGNQGRIPRPRISAAEQESLLAKLEESAQARRGTLDDIDDLKREEEERHREILRAIQEGRHEANDALVDLFDLLYDRGVPKMLMYERVGLSPARIIKLREQSERRRREQEVDDV